MSATIKTSHYAGTVSSIINEEFGIIEVTIPGIIEGVQAFPKKTELDEPKIGDIVLLTSFDPIYNSYMIYEKVRENDIIGFRSAGKMVDITKDEITVGVFDRDLEYDENTRPECKAYVKIDDEGNVTIFSSTGNIQIQTDSGNVDIDGASEINLGAGISPLVLGNVFKSIFNTHTHTVTPGNPFSGPPLTGMTDACLSKKVYTE